MNFLPMDADNHYYEAEDAFTRYIDPKMRSRCVQWVTIEGRKRILVGGKLNRFIPNPTFDPVSKPGALDAFYRAHNPQGLGVAELFGELEPIRASYRAREPRMSLMDEQGLEAIVLYPTLAVGVEEALEDDTPAVCASFGAFNRWLADDWGWSGRIVTNAYLSLADPVWAVAELERVVEEGCKAVNLRPGPVRAGGTSRSPGSPEYDRFWSAIEAADVSVSFHAALDGTRRRAGEWDAEKKLERSFAHSSLAECLSPHATSDTIAAMICHKVFERHPGLRVAAVEVGSDWVPLLALRLTKAYGMMPQDFPEPPLDTLRRHVWVSPFYEDDILGLAEIIGEDRILFGSDFPHAEGLESPVSYVNDLHGFDEAAVRRIMRENVIELHHIPVTS